MGSNRQGDRLLHGIKCVVRGANWTTKSAGGKGSLLTRRADLLDAEGLADRCGMKTTALFSPLQGGLTAYTERVGEFIAEEALLPFKISL